MPLVTNPGASRDWYPYDWRLAQTNTTTLVLDSMAESIAFGGQVFFKERTGSKTITRVGFYYTRDGLGSVTVETLVRLSGINTFYQNRPDGTTGQTVVVPKSAGEGWIRTDLFSDGGRTVSYGENLCVSFMLSTHDPGYPYGAAIYGFNQVSRGMPWTSFRDAGGGWAVQNILPNIVLEFSDGTFGTLKGAVPFSTQTFYSANFGSTPNEYGLQFRVPWNCKVDALGYFGYGLGQEETYNSMLSLYEGTTLLKEVEIDGFELGGNTTGWAWFPVTPALDPVFGTPLDPQAELTANTDYIIAWRPTNVQTMQVNAFALADAGHRAAWGDLNMGLVSRTYPDAWSAPSNTVVLRVGVRISSFSGGGPRMTADSGTFSLTGTAAGLKRGRSMVAVAGSYAWTGTAAELRRTSKRLAADAGSFVLTGGTTTTLRRKLKLSAGTGSFTLTGTAATVRRVYRLVASSTTITVSGTAASLRHGHRIVNPDSSSTYELQFGITHLRVARKLMASGGSFAIVGTAADLRYQPSRTLAALSGVYGLTGTAAELKYGRVLSAGSNVFEMNPFAALLRHGHEVAAESGAFTLTGTAATFLISTGMPAAAGSFTLTGTAASLEYGRKLSAASGSFALTGTAADIQTLGKLFPDSGSFAWTGTAATLRQGRTMPADSGGFMLTGTAASLEYGHLLAAASGSFTLTGTAASLEYGRVLKADPGAYTLTGTQADLSKGVIDCHRSSSVYVSSPWRPILSMPNGSIDKYDWRMGAYQYCGDFGPAPFEADYGIYNVSGTAANLEYGRRLVADPGSFTLTGTAASLEYGRLLVAASGSFTHTGTDAVLKKGYRLDAAIGRYDLTGVVALPLQQRRFNADGTGYTWTGTAATLRPARKLTAESGSFVVTALETAAADVFVFNPGRSMQFNVVVDPLFEQ